MLQKILIGLLALVGVLVIFISMQPDTFRITRNTTVNAPAEVVFALVNDLHRWQGWSPWAKLDPKSTISYEGPKAGTGAVFHWAGNAEVGKGSMTITQSVPNERIQLKLALVEPVQATNTAEFTFKPTGSQTMVTWTMTGHANFISKAMGLVMPCDTMVGGMFEKGLAQLKALAESKS